MKSLMYQRCWFLQLSDRVMKCELKQVAQEEVVVPRKQSCSISTPTDWCWSPVTLSCSFSVKELFLENIWSILLMGKVTSKGKVKAAIFKSLFGHKEMDLRWGKTKCHKSGKALHFLQFSGNWLWKWQKTMSYPLALLWFQLQIAYQDNIQTHNSEPYMTVTDPVPSDFILLGHVL